MIVAFSSSAPGQEIVRTVGLFSSKTTQLKRKKLEKKKEKEILEMTTYNESSMLKRKM